MTLNEDINLGAITEALNDKMDTDGMNAGNPACVVVETYHSGNDWYRVWSDGWCEQGGYANTNASSVAVTFLKQFADTNYCRQVTIQGADGQYNYHIITSASATGMTIFAWKPAYWEAKGYIS